MNNCKKIAAASLCVTVCAAQCCPAFAEAEIKNTEMVYVFQNPKGEVSKVIASDWLSIPDGEDTYSQTECDEALPVQMTVTYKLDGEEMEPEALAGKSGHLQIRYDYENLQETEIDGQKIHVPFLTVTSMLLDHDTFSNISVTNGHLIDDGERTVVVGAALPGLSEDLKLDPDTLETVDIPAYVEVEADVTDFSMEMCVSYVSNALTGKLSDKILGDETEGTGSFSDLSDTIGEVIEGISSLQEGADALQEGTASVDEGISDLNAGLAALSENSAVLNEGAEKVFQTLLDTAYAQLIEAGLEIPELTIDTYSAVLEGLLTQLDPEALKAQALEQITEQVRTQVSEQVIQSALQISKDEYDTAVQAGSITTEQQEMIEQAIDTAMETDETVQAQIEAILNQTLESEEIQQKLAAASAGYEKIEGLKTSLDSYQTFYQGVTEYTGGVDTAAAGCSMLLEGSGELADGAQAFDDAITGFIESLDSDIDLAALTVDIEKILKAAQIYTHYSEVNPDIPGEVHFIYRTDEIG